MAQISGGQIVIESRVATETGTAWGIIMVMEKSWKIIKPEKLAKSHCIL